MNAVEWITNLFSAHNGVRLGRYVLLSGPNPLDPSTPVDTPLKIVTWGSGAANYTSELPGFSQLHAENDEWIIVQNGRSSHVIRVSTPFDILMLADSYQSERFTSEILAAIEDVSEVVSDGYDWTEAHFTG